MSGQAGEIVEGSRTMRNRPYPVLKCSSRHPQRPASAVSARDAFLSGPRDETSDAMRDLVVSPAMGASTLEPGVVWTRE